MILGSIIPEVRLLDGSSSKKFNLELPKVDIILPSDFSVSYCDGEESNEKEEQSNNGPSERVYARSKTDNILDHSDSMENQSPALKLPKMKKMSVSFQMLDDNPDTERQLMGLESFSKPPPSTNSKRKKKKKKKKRADTQKLEP